jgi:F0F1-type ATP synthase membrane subunit b/b'
MHSELMSQAKEEQGALKEELKTVLDEMTYKALAEQEAAMATAIDTVQQEVPLLIYHG